jgi:hypothetical protein
MNAKVFLKNLEVDWDIRNWKIYYFINFISFMWKIDKLKDIENAIKIEGLIHTKPITLDTLKHILNL